MAPRWKFSFCFYAGLKRIYSAVLDGSIFQCKICPYYQLNVLKVVKIAHVLPLKNLARAGQNLVFTNRAAHYYQTIIIVVVVFDFVWFFKRTMHRFSDSQMRRGIFYKLFEFYPQTAIIITLISCILKHLFVSGFMRAKPKHNIYLCLQNNKAGRVETYPARTNINHF